MPLAAFSFLHSVLCCTDCPFISAYGGPEQLHTHILDSRVPHSQPAQQKPHCNSMAPLGF